MPSGEGQTLLGVPQHSLELFAGDAGEPFEEIIQARAVFQVFKERLHRHSRPPENPGAADPSRVPFDCRTLSPIKHRGKLNRQTHTGKIALLMLNTATPLG